VTYTQKWYQYSELVVPLLHMPAVRALLLYPFIFRVGQKHIGIIGRKTTKYTALYGALSRIWPTLYLYSMPEVNDVARGSTIVRDADRE
jgi:hypothetical protein